MNEKRGKGGMEKEGKSESRNDMKRRNLFVIFWVIQPFSFPEEEERKKERVKGVKVVKVTVLGREKVMPQAHNLHFFSSSLYFLFSLFLFLSQVESNILSEFFLSFFFHQ